MSGASRWLPRSALECAEVAAWITPCLAEWSAAWLAAGSLEPLEGWRARTGLSLPPANRRDCGASGLVLCAEAEELRGLAGAILGRQPSERDFRSTADRTVVDHLLHRALEDLAQRIEAFAVILSAGGDDPTHILPIGLQGQRLLAIEAPRACIIAMAIALADTPRTRTEPAKRADAIRVQSVGIAGLLGCNRLLLSDLEDLGVGDVLPLMSDATAALDIVVGTARIPAGATLAQEGDHFILHIERPASEWRTTLP